MKGRLLGIYLDTPGGGNFATKHYLEEIKKLNPDFIEVIILKINDFSGGNKSRKSFNLVRNFFNIISLTKSTIERVNLSGFAYIYSPSLLILVVCFFYKQRGLFYHYHGEHFQDFALRAGSTKSLIKRYFYAYPFYYILAQLEKFFIVRFEKIFVPVRYSKQQLIKLFPPIVHRKINVIPYGCDQSIFKPLRFKTDKRLHLLFSGRMDPNKGISELVAALTLLPSSIDFTFLAAFLKTSQDEYEMGIISKLKDNLTGKFKIFWDLDSHNLAKLYQQSDLTILPSYVEQFPLVFIESISCGTPLLSTKVGELTFVQPKISDKLLLASPSPSAIANGIVRFYSLTLSERIEIRKRCIAFSKQFSWKNSAKFLINAIF